MSEGKTPIESVNLGSPESNLHRQRIRDALKVKFERLAKQSPEQTQSTTAETDEQKRIRKREQGIALNLLDLINGKTEYTHDIYYQMTEGEKRIRIIRDGNSYQVLEIIVGEDGAEKEVPVNFFLTEDCKVRIEKAQTDSNEPATTSENPPTPLSIDELEKTNIELSLQFLLGCDHETAVKMRKLLKASIDETPTYQELTNIAENLGYITPKILVEVLGLPANSTLEQVKQILSNSNIPRTNGKIDYFKIQDPLTRAQIRYYELFLENQGSMPIILDGKTIEEIFKVLDPDAFSSNDPLTLRKIIEKSFKRLPKEQKREIEETAKQRQKEATEKPDTTTEQDKKEEPKTISFLEQLFGVKAEDLENFLEQVFGVKAENIENFLDKSVGEIVDESNKKIDQGENASLSQKEIELFKNIYTTHNEINNKWKKIVEGRIEKGKKFGKGAALILFLSSLILIWQASKEKSSNSIY